MLEINMLSSLFGHITEMEQDELLQKHKELFPDKNKAELQSEMINETQDSIKLEILHLKWMLDRLPQDKFSFERRQAASYISTISHLRIAEMYQQQEE